MSKPFTEQELLNIKKLFDDGFGSRKIALQLNMARGRVMKAYKKLEIHNIGRKKPRITHLYTEKFCKICQQIKLIDQFKKIDRGDGRISYCYCIECETKNNKNKCNAYYINNKEKRKEYTNKNIKKIREKRRNLYHSNIEVRLKRLVSGNISSALKAQGFSKQGQSSLKYLPYTIKELKLHIEAQFVGENYWMTWENQGVYDLKTWDDNDSSTWKWQLDHIKPHSDFKYLSMDDQAFKDCWTLSNLRPLSAKQNVLDGVRKTRHNGNK